MTNKKFLDTLVTTGKISTKVRNWVTDIDLDDTIINVERYYKVLQNRLTGVDNLGYSDIENLIILLETLIQKDIGAIEDDLIFNYLELLLSLFKYNSTYEDILEYFMKYPVEYVLEYSFGFGNQIELNGIPLHIVSQRNNKLSEYRWSMLDSNLRTVYDDVICIEKDLRTGDIQVICYDNEKDNDKVFEYDKDKLKIRFIKEIDIIWEYE